MLLPDVKILNVTGLNDWRYQLRLTLNFMQLTPDAYASGTLLLMN